MVGAGLAIGLAGAANRSGDPVTAQTRAQGVADLVTGVPPDESRLPVVRVRDFDPFGVDGENPHERRFAVDRDPLTAWTTLTYYDPFMGGKPGVGLTVDLGAPRPVSSVDLKLVGANSNLQVLAGTSRANDPARYRVFAEVTGAGSHILLRSPRPVTARYIVVWFTRLPWIDGGYRGGVRSVVVRSG
jgi:putative peptidoglycan lipid II flippase